MKRKSIQLDIFYVPYVPDPVITFNDLTIHQKINLRAQHFEGYPYGDWQYKYRPLSGEEKRESKGLSKKYFEERQLNRKNPFCHR